MSASPTTSRIAIYALGGPFSELEFAETTTQPFLFEQHTVRTILHYSAFIQNQYSVGLRMVESL